MHAVSEMAPSRTAVTVGLLLSLAITCWAQDRAQGPLELPVEFAAVRDKIAPRPDEELWKTIP